MRFCLTCSSAASTAPLVAYYGGRGALKTIDGMAGISEVTRQIEQVLNDV